MSFNVLAIRSGLDNSDDPLHPMLSDASSPHLIALDRYDGPNVMNVVATAVRVLEAGNGSLKTVARLREVKIDIYITDGRLALACEKYDKGGGWVGFGTGALVAVTANAVSKARAASRSRGKILVGHIRYPWLRSVGASSKSGFGSTEAIRLGYSEKSASATARKMIELTLPKNIDATLVAQEIVRRAAAYRLAYYPDMAAEERAKFVSLSEAPSKLQPLPKKFDFVNMPTYFHVNARTAFPPVQQPEVRSEAPRHAKPSGPAEMPWPDVHTPGAATERPAVLADLSGSSVPEEVTSFCSQCGVRSVPGDNFCAACGASLQEATRP